MNATGEPGRKAPERVSGPCFDADPVSQAVALGRDVVVIRGVRFTIERGHTVSGQASQLRYETVLLRREDGGFAPLAYVRLSDM